MKFEWNPEKNEWLKENRGISFETIVFHLSQGDLWKVSDHPEQEKYSGHLVSPVERVTNLQSPYICSVS